MRVLVACSLLLLLASCASTASHPDLRLPPSDLVWDTSASTSSTNPLDAFARSARGILPCEGDTPGKDQSVAWIAATRDLGALFIRATCPTRYYASYTTIVNDTVPQTAPHWWVPEGGIGTTFPISSTPTGILEPPLPWLDLPPDTYYGWSASWRNPDRVFTLRFSPTRSYVIGRVRQAALRLPQSVEIILEGQPAWMTVTNDIVSVVVPQRDSTFYFAGSGSADDVQKAAAQALAHENALLPSPASR